MNDRCGWRPECGCDECECQLDDVTLEPRPWKVAAVIAFGVIIPVILAAAVSAVLAIVKYNAHDAIPLPGLL